MTLGRLALGLPGGDEDESLANQRRKLALLTVLAASRRRLSRDRLVEMFWGDQDETRARHSLSNALSHLRRVLGRNAILPHRDQIGLEPGALEWDADLFAVAVAQERWSDAIALWNGPFLDGIHVDGSAAFEQWVAEERARLDPLFLRAAEAGIGTLQVAGRWDEVAMVAGRWLDLAPDSVPAAIALLESLTAPGTRDADQRALEAFQRLAARLAEEGGRRPDRAVIARVRAIVDRLVAGDPTGSLRVPADLLLADDGSRSGGPVPFRPAASVGKRRVGRNRWLGAGGARRGAAIAAAGVAVAVLLSLGWYLGRRPRFASFDGALQTIAVGAVRPAGDSASAWLADGIPEMVVARLARSDQIGLIPLTRLRDYLPDRPPSLDDLLAASGRLGATWAVSGRITRSDQGYVMDVNVHDVRTGALVTVATVAASDPVSLADLAASRVLGAAGATGSGLRLAEVETGNPEAYRAFVRARRSAWRDGPEAAAADLDAAIAADSGFMSAVVERAAVAFDREEPEVLASLLSAFDRHSDRATPWDRGYLEAQAAFFGGEHARAEALSRDLIRRHPDDPRAVSWFVRVFSHHGKWAEADSMLERRQREIRGAEAPARRICAACGVLAARFELLANQGDTARMEQVARELVRLQPDAPLGWIDLATALSFEQRHDQAVVAGRRAVAIDPGAVVAFGRILLAAGRLAEAESVVVALGQSPAPGIRAGRLDLAASLARERGRWRAAIAALDSLEAAGVTGLRMVAADCYARIGDLASVVRLAAPAAGRPPGPGLRPPRGYAWHRGIEGDALATAGDTLRVMALIDSVERIGMTSHHARDWRIHHHLRGRLAALRGEHIDAIREFEAAWHGPAGWTRTDLAWAASLRAAGRPAAALFVLRRAYLNNLDGMSRYVPRTELHLAMAATFRSLGRADSATAYLDRVETAYRGADPEALMVLAAARR